MHNSSPIDSTTLYIFFCMKHGVDPATALWRVDTSGAGTSWYAGHRLHGHIVRLYKDDRTDSPLFASVFPGGEDVCYVNIENLLPLKPQEVQYA